MRAKIEEAFYLLLGVMGICVALAILFTIVRIGEIFAESLI